MQEISMCQSPIFYFKFERKTENNNTSPNRRGLSFVTSNLLDLTLVSAFSVQYDEDLNCAARFAIATKFAFVSTICDLLLAICVTLRKQFELNSCDMCNKRLST